MSTTAPIAYSRKVVVEHTIHIIECCNCGVDFGIGDEYMAARRKDHDWFYCPNGHPQHYPQPSTEEKKAKADAAEVERLKRLVANERQYTESERNRRLLAERQRAAAKGQVTKIKNRVGNGVCPCCNRTFVNLQRHIAGQHPDFTPAHPA